MWFTRGLGGGDREAGMLDADAWREQEQLVDALEGGPQRRGLAEVADDALGALGRSRGASGIAHEDAKFCAHLVQLAGEFAANVSGGAGNQYHRGSLRVVCQLTIAENN
jgi:hypothetical protein